MNYKKILVSLISFFLFVFLIFKGQRVKGYLGLGIMFVGLTGILVQLYLYNKKYI